MPASGVMLKLTVPVTARHRRDADVEECVTGDARGVVIVAGAALTEKPDDVSLTPQGSPTSGVPQPLPTVRRSCRRDPGSGGGASPT